MTSKGSRKPPANHSGIGAFQPGFFVEHFVKDMRLALEECRRLGISLPGLTLAESLYARLVDQGHGRLGTQALILALADIDDLPLPRPAGISDPA